ncbi:MAG: MBOAT family protein [Verrucomicrobiales bacterium]|nr:MBOAT family protein [Verrucomicrobiales bacterium]
MVFSSYIFLFGFLPVALLAYYATPMRGRSLTLTLLSYVFYGWWDPRFTLLMLVSTLIDYVCGRIISAEGGTPASRKGALIASIVSNLGILAFFKYAIFFAENLGAVTTFFGGDAPAMPIFLSHLVLPVGISFYTFQSMSYSIDLYRGHASPARSFVDFACYVSMFPQLVAGPIVRYGSVADQLRHRSHTLEGFVAGMTRFNYGFAKKILLANPMGGIADLCFEAGSLDSPLAWTGALAYAFQIYFDFSAYSDMALGLGRMFGFRFPENFASPYRAVSLTDFWRRWHISLSTFLRDYLYIPLGGNRKGAAKTYRNLILVMLIGGLWHGAQWTFVIWGLVHGLCLAGEKAWRERVALPVPPVIGRSLTIFVILISWIFFRSPNLESAMQYLGTLFEFGGNDSAAQVLAAVVFAPANVGLLVICASVVSLLPNTGDWLRIVTWGKVVFGLVLLFISIRVMGLQGFNPFLYFQF